MPPSKWKTAAGMLWRQKLETEHPGHGKVQRLTKPMLGVPAGQTLLIPRPLDVDAQMRSVRKGRLITQGQVRARLAKRAGADAACPLTTGIFMRIAAEAAEEDRRAGKARITPYWRTIRDDGSLNEKFPGGGKAQAAKLRAEGFGVAPLRKGGKPRVADFEKRLVRP